MKNENGNTPASPTAYMDQSDGSGEMYCDNVGMTKRETMAMHIMANTCWSNTDGNKPQHYQYAAESAVSLADELLKALDK